MTWALLKKDLRLLRPALLALAAFAVLFYGVIPPIQVATRDVPLLYRNQNDSHSIVGYFSAGNALMWMVLLPAFATVGAIAFAVERRERWAEWTATLPVSRRRLIAVKMIVSIGVCVGLTTANAGLLWAGTILSRYRPEVQSRATAASGLELVGPYGFNAAVMLLAAGGINEWLLREHRRSTRMKVAVVTALAVPLVFLAVACILSPPRIYFHFARSYDELPQQLIDSLFKGVAMYVPVATLLFGLALAMSSLLRSPVISAGIAIGIATALLFGNTPAFDLFTSPPLRTPYELGRNLMLLGAAGLAGMAAGVVIQFVRRTP
ncbi:MAG: hypothetical protein JWM57_3206 [Phycisphaerales bacterium]|nr:hypothetical protein [Phycisphaerales bacterium]